jgi:hypothetical protein
MNSMTPKSNSFYRQNKSRIIFCSLLGTTIIIEKDTNHVAFGRHAVICGKDNVVIFLSRKGRTNYEAASGGVTLRGPKYKLLA